METGAGGIGEEAVGGLFQSDRFQGIKWLRDLTIKKTLGILSVSSSGSFIVENYSFNLKLWLSNGSCYSWSWRLVQRDSGPLQVHGSSGCWQTLLEVEDELLWDITYQLSPNFLFYFYQLSPKPFSEANIYDNYHKVKSAQEHNYFFNFNDGYL